MKSSPVAPEGSLKSKPTWSITSGVQPRRLFIWFSQEPLAPSVVIMGGKTDVAKGRIKEAAGVLTGSDKLRTEGKANQTVGEVKQVADKDVVKKLSD